MDKNRLMTMIGRLLSMSGMTDAEKMEWAEEAESLLADGHFTKSTAIKQINGMKPLVWYVNGSPSQHYDGSFMQYLEGLGIDVSSAERAIKDCMEGYKNEFDPQGIKLAGIDPSINAWDMLVTVAMMVADYPLLNMGQLELVAPMAYQWLADIDSHPTKTWDYFHPVASEE